MKKLTNDQQELAEKYLNLFYKTVSQWKKIYPGYSFEEIYDACMNALIKSAASYDPSKDSFQAIFRFAARNEVIKIIRRHNTQMRKGVVVSIDTPVGDDEDERTVKDLLGAEDTYNFFENDLIQKSLDVLDERERYCILQRFYQDKSQEEIAVEIGRSQMQVSRILKKALEKLREFNLHKASEEMTG